MSSEGANLFKRLGDMGDLADLGLDKHVCAKHPALTSSALDIVTLA
jgi:hypothetical protein